MDIRLTSKNILVTGGTRGIGRSIVRTFADAGANVLTCYRQDEEGAESLVEELREVGGEHHVVKADVGGPAGVDLLMKECATRLGHLDVVVNNAGFITHVPFAELSAEEWRTALDTNLTSAMLVIQQALPLLTPGASIVNVGSRAATVGVPLRAHYTAAKAGLIGLTRSLAKELGPRGFRVNVVAPGPVETDREVAPEVRERYQRLIALGRLGRPQEIANVVAFLAADLSSFVTGETINVDGGV
ncbi:3-oxoacyl-ACP reductase family protein [Streptosporangium sp. KLBMP 9127]|nr:3-oxoacyl-ACP reductase FabG [Streptosporangium sp. KLBMP 9127]